MSDRFAEAYEEHRWRVYHYCLARARSAVDAEDLTAETFARFAAHADRIAPAATYSWLARVSANLCIDHARRARRTVPVDPHATADAGGLPDRADTGAALMEYGEVWEALTHLNPTSHQIVYLRVVNDLPFAQIARLLRKREPAVRMAYYRAIKELGRTLEVDDDR